MLKKFTLVAMMGALISVSFGAATANAATARNGECESGEFCLFYNSDQGGSVSDFTTSVSDYGDEQPGCYDFKGAGNGKGLCVKNEAASVWNRTGSPVTVYFNSGYGGSKQTIAANTKANLNSDLKNENASHKLNDSGSGGGGGGTGGTYGAPNDNPHPSATARAPQATKRTQHVDDEIRRLTGETHCWVGDYRSNEPSDSNHNTGNALDCTISNAIGQHPNAAQKEQGWKLANWLKKYASKLDVRYVIWQGKIWSVARASEGWRTYNGGSGVTSGHYDHVHVSIQNPHGD
ncbi:peptidase inhibitor family I36 [Lentzea atacamensis]|uniref:Peptidase inhibitor family I36 n=2 Tax=Lentzea TaxID=165301 RepID=A0A316HS37_9PSEU|nr:peptidase inhibitor family I36 protein [Lentzea atacamensis]PWK83276.1 peptidase inhibitor family I36 [Lentzea atacamensis]RAS65086.1 peptidase inhibitor family I36 [Lentzea atacamensis]